MPACLVGAAQFPDTAHFAESASAIKGLSTGERETFTRYPSAGQRTVDLGSARHAAVRALREGAAAMPLRSVLG